MFVSKNGKAEKVRIKPDLDVLYTLLECDTIDIVKRKIGGSYYSIVCDDEGLYKENSAITMLNEETLEPMLVGNLFICDHDSEGNMVGLTDMQIARILEKYRGYLLGNF